MPFVAETMIMRILEKIKKFLHFNDNNNYLSKKHPKHKNYLRLNKNQGFKKF